MRVLTFLAASSWLVGLLAGCGGPVTNDDAGQTPDAGPDASTPDAGPPVPVALDHCSFEAVPPTGRAGGAVTSGELSAGTAEAILDLPIGSALGAYTARSEGFGAQGFLSDGRRTDIARSFSPSIGVSAAPRVRALALRAGGETVILMKVDLGASYQGLLHEIEQRLGPEYSGKVVLASSHSHNSFANFTGHAALYVGFSEFSSTVFDALVEQCTAAAQAAIAALVPAKIGFSYDGAFDMEDRVNRDRRDANDELAGGREDDHHLYVIRVDALDDTPLALVPIFGMHGTLQDADNPIVTTDSTGGLERVLEEEFDREVLVMHLQGAGGDVSPAGSGAIDCGGLRLCTDFAKEETIGWYGRDAILAAYASAGTAMQTELEIEMLTRTIPLGPDWTNFRVRGGALEYAPWDGRRVCDGEVFDGNGDLLSPIDEFNAPYGAALCDGALTALRSQAQMPGTRNLMGYPYRGCNRLEGVLGLFETVLNLELGEPPVCETTRTVVSALRLGDRMLVTLPGEPVTLLSAHLRSLSPMPPERTIVVGYAQDHQGYLLRPEDWLSGGYEPQITFWGPLAGELIVEQAAALMPLAMTPVRENGNEGGVERIATPTIRDDFGPDSAPLAGTIPATVPDRLVARLYQPITSAQPPASAPRLTNVLFTWIGEDPITGTPRAHIERESETSPGTWEPLRRRSGRLVEDADVILTWTPQPINGDPQTHYWTVEWQVAAPLGMPGFASPAARAGLPLGRYKIVVQGSGYTVESDPFDVTPGALELRSTVMGSDLVIEVGYHAPEGYRLLDLQAGANRFVPVRGASVEVVLTPGGAQTLATDASGRVTLAGAATGVTRVQVTDPYGNTGSLDL